MTPIFSGKLGLRIGTQYLALFNLMSMWTLNKNAESVVIP